MRVAWELGVRLGLPVREQADLAIEYVASSTGGEDMERLREASTTALEAMQTIDDRTADDEQLIAQLRVDTGYGWFFAGHAERARTLYEEGIAALEGGPPTRGRARLLAALGWLSWRAGPVDAAPVILERALAEARAISDLAIERLAMHDLGIAESMTGRRQEGLERIRVSRELAREAGDTTLFLRATNNLASTSMGNGRSWARDPVRDRGRSGHRSPLDPPRVHLVAGWHPARPTRVPGQDGRGPGGDRGGYRRGGGDLGPGQPGGAPRRSRFRPLDDGRSRGRGRGLDLDPERWCQRIEPQAVMYVAVEEALPRWDADPEGAVAVLVEAASDPASTASAAEGALWLARMALRTKDRHALEVARSLVDVGIEGATGESQRRIGDHVHALAVDPPDIDGLISAAEGLEASGYLGLAVDAWADAALVAARAGADATRYQEQAAAMYATCHMVPMLRPLPETRWTTGV